MKRHLLLAIPLILFSQLAISAPVSISLMTKTLVSERLTEARGDELYFTITEFRKPKNSTYTIPELPLYWRSETLPQMKDVALWSSTLQDNESVQLQVSLVERDSPPWDVDDLLGTFKVTLRNENGVIMQLWERKEDSAVISGLKQDFDYRVEFNGGGGLYHGIFKLAKGLMRLPGEATPHALPAAEKAKETTEKASAAPTETKAAM